MTQDLISNITQVRVAVAFLGEEKRWWSTIFFSDSASSFLEYTFPKSKHVDIISACEAAKLVVDQKVGANHFHLFRLGITYEEQIHKQIVRGDIEVKEEDIAIKILEDYSKLLVVDGASGPKNIGSIDNIDEDLIQAVAAEYLHAFKNNYQVHPYLN